MRSFFINQPLQKIIAIVLILIAPGVNPGTLHFGEPRSWLDLSNQNDIGQFSAFGDVNGDGKSDMVAYSPDRGTAFVALSNGQSFTAPKLWATGLPTATSAQLVPLIVIADVNGDRKADMILFKHGDGQSDGSASVYVALSNGVNFQYTEHPVWNDGFCIKEQICKVIDLNGDGKADLVAFTPITGLVWVSLSEGDRFGVNSIWHNFFCTRYEVCEVGDVDGDHKGDILLFKPKAVGNEKGNVLISSSNGSKFGAIRYGHGYFCIDNERCLVGDLNADGKADILLIKGFSADKHQPVEILVSLSNGEKFINSTPFSWGKLYRSANSRGWGNFNLADVTGDGRSDLILSEGGHYLVYTTTDQAHKPKPGQTGTKESPIDGLRQVNLFNCDPDQHSLHYWIIDITARTKEPQGSFDAMYSETGFCPDSNVSPFTLNLTDGHLVSVVAVDPEQIGCEGRNDPTILGCVEEDFTFKGDARGGVINIIIPVTQSIRSLSIKKATPIDKILALRAARVDFSVKEADFLQWLGNQNTPYPSVVSALLEMLDGKRLKKPVYIDVIVWNYEKKRITKTNNNIDLPHLKAAVVEGYNTRNATKYSNFESLIE